MASNQLTVIRLDVCSGSSTVLAALKWDFRSTPINGHRQTGPVGPVRANKRHRPIADEGAADIFDPCLEVSSFLRLRPTQDQILSNNFKPANVGFRSGAQWRPSRRHGRRAICGTPQNLRFRDRAARDSHIWSHSEARFSAPRLE
jgi:hypothetical protein